MSKESSEPILIGSVRDVAALRRLLITARQAAGFRQDEVGPRRTVSRFEAEHTSMDIHGLALYARRVGYRLTLTPLNAPHVAHSNAEANDE